MKKATGLIETIVSSMLSGVIGLGAKKKPKPVKKTLRKRSLKGSRRGQKF